VKWKTERSFDGKLCQEYLCQKLLKFDNWFSRHSWKCWGCFFGTQCTKYTKLHNPQNKLVLHLHVYSDKLTLHSCHSHEANKQQIQILMFRQCDFGHVTCHALHCLQLIYTRIYSTNNFNTHLKYFADLRLPHFLSIRSKNNYRLQKSFGLFPEFPQNDDKKNQNWIKAMPAT